MLKAWLKSYKNLEIAMERPTGKIENVTHTNTVGLNQATNYSSRTARALNECASKHLESTSSILQYTQFLSSHLDLNSRQISIVTGQKISKARRKRRTHPLSGLCDQIVAQLISKRTTLTGLYKTVCLGDLDTVRQALQRNPNQINAEDGEESTLLHCAIIGGKSDTVAFLLKSGVSLKSSSVRIGDISYDFSPLMLATILGHKQCVEALLNHRYSDPNYANQLGNILHIAILFGQSAILEQLLTKHIGHTHSLINDASSLHQRTPMGVAAFVGDLHAIHLLYQQKANIEARDEHGRTPLHLAAVGNRSRALELLMYLRADLYAKDKNGKSPKNLTSRNGGCRKVVQQLLNLQPKGPDFSRHSIERFIGSGGGPKGISLVGSAQVLEDLGIWDDIQGFAGTSAGSIGSCLGALGMNSEAMLRALREKSFIDFMDCPNTKEMQQFLKKKPTSWSDYLGMALTLLKQMSHGGSGLKERAKKLWSFEGFCEGQRFHDWISKLIEQQTGKKELTFRDLRDLVRTGKKSPQGLKFKHLHITVSRTDEQQPQIMELSSEDPKYDDVLVADAVAASIAIPGVFKGRKLNCIKPDGTRYSRPGRYRDGGLLRNYPIDAFDAPAFMNPFKSPSPESRPENWRVLGFRYASNTTPQSSAPVPSSTTLLQQLTNIVDYYYQAEDHMRNLSKKEEKRTVTINTGAIGTLDFDLSPVQQWILIMAGRRATNNYFSTKGFRPIPLHNRFPEIRQVGNERGQRSSIPLDTSSQGSTQSNPKQQTSSGLTNLLRRGHELQTQNRIDEALEIYKTVASNSPMVPDRFLFQWNYAETLKRMGHHTKALECYLDAYDLFERHMRTSSISRIQRLCLIARYLESLGRHQETLDLAREILMIEQSPAASPRSARNLKVHLLALRYRAGRAAECVGQFQKARELYNSAIEWAKQKNCAHLELIKKLQRGIERTDDWLSRIPLNRPFKKEDRQQFHALCRARRYTEATAYVTQWIGRDFYEQGARHQKAMQQALLSLAELGKRRKNSPTDYEDVVVRAHQVLAYDQIQADRQSRLSPCKKLATRIWRLLGDLHYKEENLGDALISYQKALAAEENGDLKRPIQCAIIVTNISKVAEEQGYHGYALKQCAKAEAYLANVHRDQALLGASLCALQQELTMRKQNCMRQIAKHIEMGRKGGSTRDYSHR